MAKWLRDELQNAYKPTRKGKSVKSTVANLATADEEDASVDESIIGSNLGTPCGYLKG